MTRAYDNAVDARYPSGRRNLIINGAMQVAQRSTSETGETNGGYHTLDRFRLRISGGTVSSSQQSLTVGQTDIPSQFKYFHRFNPTTSNDNCGIEYRIEDVTTVSGETVTFSLYAKGTNPGGGELDIIFSQNFGSGGSSAVSTTVGTLTLTSEWTRYTYTFDIPSISGKTVGTGSFMEIEIGQPDDDESTDAYTFDSTGWQLEVGNVATPFEHRSYGEELALCQRYYQSWGGTQGSEYMPVFGNAYNSTTYEGVFKYIRTMRASPTFTASGSFEFNDVSANYSTGSLSGDVQALQSLRMRTTGASGLTQYRSYMLRANGTSARITLDAEL